MNLLPGLPILVDARGAQCVRRPLRGTVRRDPLDHQGLLEPERLTHIFGGHAWEIERLDIEGRSPAWWIDDDSERLVLQQPPGETVAVIGRIRDLLAHRGQSRRKVVHSLGIQWKDAHGLLAVRFRARKRGPGELRRPARPAVESDQREVLCLRKIDGRGEVRTSQVRASKVGELQVGAAEIGALKIGWSQPGPDELGVGEDGSPEVGAGRGIREIRLGEVNTAA